MNKKHEGDTRTAFLAEVERLSDAVYSSKLLSIPDHRLEHPWLTGCLGDPFAPVWFVAESPSLTQVKRAEGALTTERQRDTSPGDKLFRKMLVKHGFKQGSESDPNGWKCYITDIIKSAYKVKDWNEESGGLRLAVARVWSPVLRYEIEQGKPQIIVILGKSTTERPLRILEREGLIPGLPPTIPIRHYSYIASRPQGSLGPMHPQRVADWDAEFAAIARRAQELT